MAGAFTTKTVSFPGLGNLTLIVWDESGAGTGPYAFGHVASDGAGGLIVPATAANQLLAYDATATAGKSLLVDVNGNPLTSDPEEHLGNLGGHTPDVRASFIKPASATVYTAGDHITATGTAVPLEFTVARNTLVDANRSGRVIGATGVIQAASGTVVFPAISLWLFRPVANIPFAAGAYPADNAVMSISAAAMIECVAKLDFTASWSNHLGGAGLVGSVGWQESAPSKRPFGSFNLTGLGEVDLLGVVQDTGGWNPGNIAYTFSFKLDVDQD